MSKITRQMRLYPTVGQARVLMAHCQEYISTVNVLVAAIDADLLPEKVSTRHFSAQLPSAVKNQALRDAQSVFTRVCTLGRLPVLKKPICQWNNQNWQREQGILILPVHHAGKTQQMRLLCADIPLEGKAGLLRIKKKRGKWIADIALTLPDAPASEGQAVMGIDLGIKVPAVVHVLSKGTHFFGNGRYQHTMRRRFYSRRKKLQQAKKTRAVKKSKGTTCTSRGAKARKNNRIKNTWSFYQLTHFITYKAERLGIKVEQVDPAYTSKQCPACSTRNNAQDRTYVCAQCGWRGHRDTVGAINISRRAGLAGQRRGATGA